MDPDKEGEVEQPKLDSEEVIPDLKMIEEAQDDKVVMTLTRNATLPYSILVVN